MPRTRYNAGTSPTPRRGGLDRAAAAVEGAVEGLAEGVERYGLVDASHRAIDEGDRFAASVQRENRPGRPSRAAQKLHEATDRAQGRLHQAQEFVREKVEDTRHKAQAVAETTRRATQAPAELSRDLGRALDSWATGFVAGLGWMVGAGIAALFALTLLTAAAVAALAGPLGMGGALLAIGVAYVVIGAVCIGVARSVRSRARTETRRHVEAAKEDLRHVGEPVREAFGAQSSYPRGRM